MPKLKESEHERKNNLLRAYIAKNMTLYHITDEQVAVKLRCVKRTFQNRKKNPDNFSLKELRSLIEFLKFTNEEKTAIL